MDSEKHKLQRLIDEYRKGQIAKMKLDILLKGESPKGIYIDISLLRKKLNNE